MSLVIFKDSSSVEPYLAGFGLMQNQTFEGIKVMRPRCLLEHTCCVSVACTTSVHNPAWAEIDIFGMVLTRKRWRKETHDMHASYATI